MGKGCCAVGYTNHYAKGNVICFYYLPADSERGARWIAAIGRKNFTPTEHTWSCSTHFVSSQKSNDPLLSDYVSSVFAHTKSPVKRKLVADLHRFERISQAKRSRRENGERIVVGRVSPGSSCSWKWIRIL